MKYNQNEKLKQVDFCTMVVGVDVEIEIHYATAFDYRGLAVRRIQISNDALSFEAIKRWTDELMEKHSKTQVTKLGSLTFTNLWKYTLPFDIIAL